VELYYRAPIAGISAVNHRRFLSQVYEGLLLKMGEKGNDGGQFFTPRDVIRAVVKAVDPSPRDTIYDPCCGTGGFLIEAFKHMGGRLGDEATGADVTAMGSSRLYGREKEHLIFPIALANLALHGIDAPNLWHGNTLAGREEYGGLWHDAPPLFDIVLTNPPFGGQENADVQTGFAYRTSATQILFLQHVIDSLTAKGRCGMVVDEGVMSGRTRTPLSRPSVSCSTAATFGPSSRYPPALSPRPAPA